MSLLWTLQRSELEEWNACELGMDLFNDIAKTRGTFDTIEIEWTPFLQVLLAAGFPAFAEWLRDVGLLPQVTLWGANLSHASLYCAHLTGLCLREADLRCAELFGADLDFCDLGEANLQRADLRQTSLIGAYLSQANLEGADLRGAYLDHTNLWNARRYDSDPPIPGWVSRHGFLKPEDER